MIKQLLNYCLMTGALLASSISLNAQNCEPLQSANSSGLESLLSGDDKIISACIISEGSDYIAIRVAYSGFTSKDFKVVGKVMDNIKKPLREFEDVTMTLPKGGNSFDLQFSFKSANKAYTKSSVESKYLAVIISPANDPLSGFDIGGTSILGTSAMYKLDRSWAVGAGGGDNSKVTVNIILTPYRSASTIKQ